MTDKEILALLKEAFEFAAQEEAIAVKDLAMSSELSQFGISSIVALEMAGYVEEKLDIVFADDELANISTIEGFINLIRQQTNTVAA